MPSAAVIAAVLPLVGKAGAGGLYGEIRPVAGLYRRVGRLGQDDRLGVAEGHTHRVRGHGAVGILHHAVVQKLGVCGAARDVQLGGLGRGGGGIMPSAAVIAAVLPLVGKAGAGGLHGEIRPVAGLYRRVGRLGLNDRFASRNAHADRVGGNGAVIVFHHAVVQKLGVCGAARDVQLGGLGRGGGGIMPSAAVIAAVLPLVGKAGAGGLHGEIRACAGYDRRIGRLGQNDRLAAVERHADRVRRRGAVGVLHHAVVQQLRVGGAAGDVKVGGLGSGGGGILPRAAAVGAVLPLIGKARAGGLHGEIRACAGYDRRIGRLVQNDRLAVCDRHPDALRRRGAVVVGDHAAVIQLRVGGTAGDVKVCGLGSGGGGVFPRAAAVGAVLPVIGQARAGGFHGEAGAVARFYRRIGRLRQNDRLTVCDRHADAVRRHGAAGVGDHAPVQKLGVGGTAGDVKVGGLGSGGGGILPRAAAVGAVLPLIGQAGAGGFHGEIRAGARLHRGIGRLVYDDGLSLADLYADALCRRGAVAVGDHAPVQKLGVGGTAGDVKVGGLRRGGGGILPRAAAVGAVLPLI